MNTAGMKRKLHVASLHLRQARVVAKAMTSQHHPILAQIIPMRRCNLACAYCSEFDATSSPVPLETMVNRIKRLADLGTTVITISGGEPLLHPRLDNIISAIRQQGSIATLITNGYLLTPQRIRELNSAGLDHLQISIDNVQPDAVSKKSLKVLHKKLRWLSQYATFQVSINSVLGTSTRPGDTLAVARSARELGFATTVGIVHDNKGQMRSLSAEECRVYEDVVQATSTSFGSFAYYNQFQRNLIEGRPNYWNCRAGSRYLYICEDGLVHYCSQQRGTPGIPLEKYAAEDLKREYATVKSCAPFCTISCVHQVSLIDQFREQPKESLRKFFPSRGNYAPPAPVRMLAWIFLPPERSSMRNLIRRAVTRAALFAAKLD